MCNARFVSRYVQLRQERLCRATYNYLLPKYLALRLPWNLAKQIGTFEYAQRKAA